MIESALLAACGCAVGLVGALGGVTLLRSYAGSSMVFPELTLNLRVVAAAVASAAGAALFFGLVPAMGLQPRATDALSAGARLVGTAKGRRRRAIFVALQAAAAIALLVLVGLVVRTTWKLARTPSGFDPSRVLTFKVGLTGPHYADIRTVERFGAELEVELTRIPGVASAGIVDRLPVADRETTATLTRAGDASSPLDERPTVTRALIAGEFLASLRIPLVRGRLFSTAEMQSSAAVALVNAEAARRFWPDRDPVGERIALDATPGAERWLEIVGVVGDVRNADIDQPPNPLVYQPWSTHATREFAIVLKSAAEDPLQLVSAARAAVQRLDANQPIYDVASMTQVLFNDIASSYVLAALLTAVGLLALVLSAAGVYGMVSHAVSQRRRELGLRLALGARPRALVRTVMVNAATPIMVGGTCGFIGAVLSGVAIAAYVPELDASDPSAYVAVVVAMFIVTLTASYLPARSAVAGNPLEALREQ
ncbi:MAG: ABC transporter permease [Vicinamibacterales bacterium]